MPPVERISAEGTGASRREACKSSEKGCGAYRARGTYPGTVTAGVCDDDRSEYEVDLSRRSG